MHHNQHNTADHSRNQARFVSPVPAPQNLAQHPNQNVYVVSQAPGPMRIASGSDYGAVMSQRPNQLPHHPYVATQPSGAVPQHHYGHQYTGRPTPLTSAYSQRHDEQSWDAVTFGNTQVSNYPSYAATSQGLFPASYGTHPSYDPSELSRPPSSAYSAHPSEPADGPSPAYSRGSSIASSAYDGTDIEPGAVHYIRHPSFLHPTPPNPPHEGIGHEIMMPFNQAVGMQGQQMYVQQSGRVIAGGLQAAQMHIQSGSEMQSTQMDLQQPHGGIATGVQAVHMHTRRPGTDIFQSQAMNMLTVPGSTPVHTSHVQHEHEIQRSQGTGMLPNTVSGANNIHLATEARMQGIVTPAVHNLLSHNADPVPQSLRNNTRDDQPPPCSQGSDTQDSETQASNTQASDDTGSSPFRSSVAGMSSEAGTQPVPDGSVIHSNDHLYHSNDTNTGDAAGIIRPPDAPSRNTPRALNMVSTPPNIPVAQVDEHPSHNADTDADMSDAVGDIRRPGAGPSDAHEGLTAPQNPDTDNTNAGQQVSRLTDSPSVQFSPAADQGGESTTDSTAPDSCSRTDNASVETPSDIVHRDDDRPGDVRVADATGDHMDVDDPPYTQKNHADEDPDDAEAAADEELGLDDDEPMDDDDDTAGLTKRRVSAETFTAILASINQTIDEFVEDHAKKHGFTTEQIYNVVRSILANRISNPNPWLQYMKYFKFFRVQELRRIYPTEPEDQLPRGAAITQDIRTQCYKAFSLEYPGEKRRELLSTFESILVLQDEEHTVTQRAKAFKHHVEQLERQAEMVQRRFGFETAFVVVGSNAHQDDRNADMFESQGLQGFFQRVMRSQTSDEITGHARSHAMYRLSEDTVVLNMAPSAKTSEKIVAASSVPAASANPVIPGNVPLASPLPSTSTSTSKTSVPLKTGQTASTSSAFHGLTEEEKGSLISLGNAPTDEALRELSDTSLLLYIKYRFRVIWASIPDLPSRAQPPTFSGSWPWSTIPTKLAEDGLKILNWPTEVICPGESTRRQSKGINVLKHDERLELARSLAGLVEAPISMKKQTKQDLILGNLVAVIYGCAPVGEDLNDYGLRVSVNRANCKDIRCDQMGVPHERLGRDPDPDLDSDDSVEVISMTYTTPKPRTPKPRTQSKARTKTQARVKAKTQAKVKSYKQILEISDEEPTPRPSKKRIIQPFPDVSGSRSTLLPAARIPATRIPAARIPAAATPSPSPPTQSSSWNMRDVDTPSPDLPLRNKGKNRAVSPDRLAPFLKDTTRRIPPRPYQPLQATSQSDAMSTATPSSGPGLGEFSQPGPFGALPKTNAGSSNIQKRKRKDQEGDWKYKD